MDSLGLPANALCFLLDGFAHATNEAFKQLCVTLSAMSESTLMQSSQANKSMKQKSFDVLKDLELTYIHLSTGHQWEGVGYTGLVLLLYTDDQQYSDVAMAARH